MRSFQLVTIQECYLATILIQEPRLLQMVLRVSWQNQCHSEQLELEQDLTLQVQKNDEQTTDSMTQHAPTLSFPKLSVTDYFQLTYSNIITIQNSYYI